MLKNLDSALQPGTPAYVARPWRARSGRAYVTLLVDDWRHCLGEHPVVQAKSALRGLHHDYSIMAVVA